MTKREKVRLKFNGLCAYTGKPLDDNWEIDHLVSKNRFLQIEINSAHYKNFDTGKELSVDEYWTLYYNSKNENGYFSCEHNKLKSFKYIAKKTRPHKDCDKIENLVPAIKIVNHYKRSFDLNDFRNYMMNFHIRLAKLPKKTTVEKTKKRIIYMNELANLFAISADKPFCGKFYFETL